VTAAWREDSYEPEAAASEAADTAVAELAARGSPSHDGQAARLVSYREHEDGLALELQPARWSLRLVAEQAAQSISALCVVRSADGRWLAGRRAAWLAAWPGRWALGAGGAVEVGENPAETLGRELEEEWSVTPERLSVEALISVPSELVLLVGLAWLPDGAEVSRDPEHDEHDWWPADVEEWPEEADAPLRAMAGLLSQA
jgi:ADP-ribose pyrophosphatase YjhB (NUDIX family)